MRSLSRSPFLPFPLSPPPQGTRTSNLGAIFMSHQLVTHLGFLALVDNLTSREHGLPVVALGEVMDIELGEVFFAPGRIRDGLDGPLHITGVVDVMCEVEIGPANGEAKLMLDRVGSDEVSEFPRAGGREPEGAGELDGAAQGRAPTTGSKPSQCGASTNRAPRTCAR
jgi:hypothetical protein